MYQPIKKKWSLSRSYFKLCYGDQPRDPYQCLDYYKEHGQRPFIPYGIDQKEIIYNMFVEYQKRNSSDMKYFDQFYTPLKTAERLVELIRKHGNPQTICDACCGYGSITQFIEPKSKDFVLTAFDLYLPNVQFANNIDGLFVEHKDFRGVDGIYDCIISNPPFTPLPEFLEWVHSHLNVGGYAVLLLPCGYLQKERPKALVETIDKFTQIHREPMQEKFETTGINCDLYVIRK